MPPQPGMFALPYSSTHKARADVIQPDGMGMTLAYHQQAAGAGIPGGMSGPDGYVPHQIVGPSGSRHEDGKREKKRKDVSGKVGREMSDRRNEGRHITESISALHSSAIQLASRPSTHPLYTLRMYPVSLERSAMLVELDYGERHALGCVETAYEEERERVEEEWRKGRERVRERLLEGLEEQRRRAREEKDGEGVVNDVSLDSHSRSHITRKLRNKIGGSPPPTPAPSGSTNGANGLMQLSNGLLSNPHSLAVEELPSPFPFPLTAVPLTTGGSLGATGGGNGGGGGRRRNKGGGADKNGDRNGVQKSLLPLQTVKEIEIEADLNEIRRGNKRRRVAAVSSSTKVP